MVLEHQPSLRGWWGVSGAELQVHAPTRQLMQDHYGPRGLEINEARLRMATLPSPSEVSPCKN